jgi:hypothetical protein
MTTTISVRSGSAMSSQVMCAHASFIHASVDDEDDDGGVSGMTHQQSAQSTELLYSE